MVGVTVVDVTGVAVEGASVVAPSKVPYKAFRYSKFELSGCMLFLGFLGEITKKLAVSYPKKDSLDIHSTFLVASTHHGIVHTVSEVSIPEGLVSVR